MANNMTVYVCPSRDIECGQNPRSWCESCPQRASAQEAAEEIEVHKAFCRGLTLGNEEAVRRAWEGGQSLGRALAPHAPAPVQAAPTEPAARFSCHLERDFGKNPCDRDCGKLRCMYPTEIDATPAPVAADTLTEEQCNAFRRLPLSFNDMVRAIHEAGRAASPARAIPAQEQAAAVPAEPVAQEKATEGAPKAQEINRIVDGWFDDLDKQFPPQGDQGDVCPRPFCGSHDISDRAIAAWNRRAILAPEPLQAASPEPFGYWHQGQTEEESSFFKHGDFSNVACDRCIKLYARPPGISGTARGEGEGS